MVSLLYSTSNYHLHYRQQTLIEELQILQSRADYAEEEALQYKDQYVL